jgi:hypothetical protein
LFFFDGARVGQFRFDTIVNGLTTEKGEERRRGEREEKRENEIREKEKSKGTMKEGKGRWN